MATVGNLFVSLFTVRPPPPIPVVYCTLHRVRRASRHGTGGVRLSCHIVGNRGLTMLQLRVCVIVLLSTKQQGAKDRGVFLPVRAIPKRFLGEMYVVHI